MKNIVLIAVLLFSSLCYAQIGDRTIINGEVTVPVGDDPEGIAVFNTTTNRGTVTNASGEFVMAVAVGDEISFSALQYQEFTVVIDQNVIDAKEINVVISESATVLEEVIVRPFDLSGNVEVDVNRIPVEVENLPTGTAADINPAEWDFRPDELTTPENAAMRDSMMENGLNFANIFRALFADRTAGNEEFDPIDEDVRRLYDDEFFREYLDIEQRNISEFILFAEENGLTEEMLEEGNELELIQFLIRQSDRYKAQLESE